MASRGAMVAGSSGADFEHREQVAAQYQLSVVNKSRLRCSIFFHCALWLVMLAKLSADILDRLDIFILELEELQIPQPVWWEWVWLCSPLSALLALSGVRRNSALRLRRYALAVLALGVAPLLYCLLYYCGELYTYLTSDVRDLRDLHIQMWQPVWWEWVWLCSPLSALLALSGVRRNSALRLRRYALAVLALGVAPLLYCLLYYCGELYTYLTSDVRDLRDLHIQMWQGMPVCALWLVFVALGAQVHGFQLLFTRRLLAAWRARTLLKHH